MKKVSVFFGGTILLVSLFAAIAFKPAVNRPSANGQGTLDLGDNFRHFSFHANTMPDGSVQGSGVLTYTGGERKIMFDIDCLIVSGNIATMGGIITKADPNPEFVGTRCRFRVQDNGEGSNASEDRMSGMNVGLPPNAPCANANVLNPIISGNIQVK